ncbi:hypothetical protein HI914_05084 [Erysiphe necator]|nr:hypothetical protein HI914_05084 [Erysiphe necator]
MALGHLTPLHSTSKSVTDLPESRYINTRSIAPSTINHPATTAIHWEIQVSDPCKAMDKRVIHDDSAKAIDSYGFLVIKPKIKSSSER